MVIVRFPPLSHANVRGLLAIGGDLEPESLLLAYSSGIFPWPYDEETLAWYAPPRRAILRLDEFHISKSLARTLRSKKFECRMNSNFRKVITSCAELTNRPDQNATWITQELAEAYCELHDRGIAHSFECYYRGELAGGLYGLRLGDYFSAESSFYRIPNASKAAMCFMADYLRSQGFTWFDCQVLSPFSESFGATEVSRATFMKMLREALPRESSPY